MKTTIAITMCIYLLIPLGADAQKTVWIKEITGQEAMVSWYHKVAADNNNNFYVMADFEKEILFNSNILLESSGNTDVFLAKINKDGDEVLWGRQISGIDAIREEGYA